jgi:hypothetical protein
VNGDSSLASDNHSIQSEVDSPLLYGQQLRAIAVKSNISEESDIGENISSIGHRAVGITNLKSGTDLSAPRSDWTASDFDVLKTQEVSLLPFDTLSICTI